jgi:hypothetical protein
MTFTANTNGIKNPCYRIYLNDVVAAQDQFNNGINEIKLVIDNDDLNCVTIEHYNKLPSDTIVKNNKIVADVGFNLDSVKLDNLQFTQVYLNWHEFAPDYKGFDSGPQKMRNNLYFGLNGSYKLQFYGNTQRQEYYQYWIDEEQSNFLQQISDKHFNRFGQEVEVDSEFDVSIHDLARIVNNG